MTRFISLLGLCLCLALCSCNTSEKLAAEVNTLITNQVDSASTGLFRFEDFGKVDGREITGDGATRYELMFKGFIATNQSVCWKDDHILKIVSKTDVLRGFTNTSYPLSFEVEACEDKSNENYYDKDMSANVTGTAYFEKRDSGWVLLDYMLSDSSVKLKF